MNAGRRDIEAYRAEHPELAGRVRWSNRHEMPAARFEKRPLHFQGPKKTTTLIAFSGL
jgi:hypothetical protein